MGENQNWKMAWKMENLFSWWIFWLDGALRQIPMVVINHSDYSVIFITNWSALMFLTDDKFLGSKSFTALKICVQKKLRWDQLSSENWPFHQWTLSADNKEKVKYERGSHLEILQRSSISLPTCWKLYKKVRNNRRISFRSKIGSWLLERYKRLIKWISVVTRWLF